ncbi:acetyltransferase [Vibrio cholerae]|nr:acetyltransferase [Vibrio cholerae]
MKFSGSALLPLNAALCALNHNVENGDKWKNIFYIQA